MRQLLLLALAMAACDRPAPPVQPPVGPQTAPAPPDPAFTAVIEGRVRYAGPAPKPRFHDVSGNAWCNARHKGRLADEELVVNPDGTLRNVFVYVKSGVEGRRYPVPETAVTLDQVECRYAPRVLGVQAGRPLVVRSSDDTIHNVHLRGTLNPEANDGFPGSGFEKEYRLANPEVMIRVTCDIHSWMRAWIGVLPHPCFAVTGADGSFELKPLPPGRYVVEAWHESLGTRTATIDAGGKARLDFEFQTK